MLDLAQESYPNIEAFYTRVSGARHSPESDYGVWWKGPDGDNWRVTFVHDTGHVYAIRLGGTVSFIDTSIDAAVISAGQGEGPVIVLGQLKPFTEADEARAKQEARDRGEWRRVHAAGNPPLEKYIKRWAERCGEQGSLEWMAERIRKAQELGC